MATRTRALVFFGSLIAMGPSAPVLADDWQVTRSAFDPRILAPIKAELRRHPEDRSLLRRLIDLYRKHSSLDKLGAELLAQAEKSGTGSDYLVAAEFERERGRLEEAKRLLEQAVGRPGGPDPIKAALLLADLSLRHAPPDIQSARRSLEGALALYKPGDAQRQKLLRRLIDLYTQAGEAAPAAQLLGELIEGTRGPEVLALRRERAEALAKSGKPAEALAEWRRLAESGTGQPSGRAVQRAEAELKIGELCEATHDDLGALAAYRRGLSLLPNQHYLRRELYEHLITLSRKRDELSQLLTQLEKEWPAANRSFADWELLGRLYDERGDIKSATNAYRSALRKEPHNIDVRRRLISILERSGVTSEVLAEYEQLILQAPGDSRAYLELAERLDKIGQRQQALAWLRRAAARFAGDPSLHSALADIYQRWGEAALALAEAELLVRLDPRDESYVVNLGEMYWARGRKDKADEVWRRVLNLAPSRTLGQAHLADIYAEHNLMPQALELYQKAVNAEPNNLQLRRGLALCSERLSLPVKAVHQWEQIYFSARAPTERPLRLESRQHLAKLIRRETRLMPSLYSWQRRLQAQLNGLAPHKLDAAELLALGLLVADLDLQLGQVNEAESILSQLEKQFAPSGGPALAEVLLALVPVYQQQRKLEDAISKLKRAAELLPDRRRELYSQLAELSLQSYHDEDAVRYAQQAVVDAQGELRLGEILERRDDNGAAMAAYRRAIELDGRLFRAHMALARLHLGRGELSQAATIYREVVRQATQEELVLEAGRKAIDLHEYLGNLDDLLRELQPLGYAPTPKPVYRKLLLLLYERYATPLLSLARVGDAHAQAELLRLGQSGFKPLAETLVDGDSSEQRLAVMLLSAMGKEGAAPALLNLAGAVPPSGPVSARKEEREPSKSAAASAGPGAADIDLRVDALLAAARLEDPRSFAQLVQLSQSAEKQIRLGALYGLVRLAGKLDKPVLIANAATVFEQAVADPRAAVKALGYLGYGALGMRQGLLPPKRAQLLMLLEKRRTQADAVDELAAAAAVHALGQAGERSAVPLLIELLRAGNDEVERQAAWALGMLGDPRALEPLLRAVFLKNESIRQVAVAALQELGPARSEPGGGGKLEPSRKAPPKMARLPMERRTNDGLDVARWLADSATYASSPAKPWLSPRAAAPLIAALSEALRFNRDIALRTFCDLLGSTAAFGSKHATAGHGAPDFLTLGPLSEQLAAQTPAERELLLRELGRGLLPMGKKLALSPALNSTNTEETTVREQALLLLGRLAAFSDVELQKGALAALLEVARSEAPPMVILRAVQALSKHAAELSAQALLDPARPALLDGLLAKSELWVRLSTLEVIAQPGGRAFVSANALRKAAEDSDGFVRDAAQQLLQQSP